MSAGCCQALLQIRRGLRGPGRIYQLNASLLAVCTHALITCVKRASVWTTLTICTGQKRVALDRGCDVHEIGDGENQFAPGCQEKDAGDGREGNEQQRVHTDHTTPSSFPGTLLARSIEPESARRTAAFFAPRLHNHRDDRGFHISIVTAAKAAAHKRRVIEEGRMLPTTAFFVGATPEGDWCKIGSILHIYSPPFCMTFDRARFG